MKQGGWPSVFVGKDKRNRYQGITTNIGARWFEAKRRRLAKLAALSPKTVSDGDVFEYLARGEAETIAYIAKREGVAVEVIAARV
jgi:hypothetical protein